MAGPISALDWSYVFYMLMACDLMAMLLLVRIVSNEVKERRRRGRRPSMAAPHTHQR